MHSLYNLQVAYYHCPLGNCHCRSANTVITQTLQRLSRTIADNQKTVQFPIFQGECVNCEDNTSRRDYLLGGMVMARWLDPESVPIYMVGRRPEF